MALDAIKVHVDQVRSGKISSGEIGSGCKNAHHPASGEIAFYGIDIIKKAHEKSGTLEACPTQYCRAETAVSEIVVIECRTGEVKTGKIPAVQYLLSVYDFLNNVPFVYFRFRMMLPTETRSGPGRI